MFRYCSTFLCSLRWQHPERLLDFLDALKAELKLNVSLNVTARERFGESRMPALRGEFTEVRARLDIARFAVIDIADSQWGPEGAKVYFHFENPPTNSNDLIKHQIRILTLSFRSDLWSVMKSGERPARFLAKVEELFAELGSLYGYTHGTEHIIASRYSQIIGSHGAGLRIMDFDYTRHIEGVYSQNYLSAHLVEKLGPDLYQHLENLKDDIQWKPLSDGSGHSKGIALSLLTHMPRSIQALERVLKPLLLPTRASAV